MKQIYVLGLLLMASFCYSQEDFNMEVIGTASYPEGGNDIWGYVAPDSTEYAVVGTRENTRIYSLSDPTAPEEVIAIRGATTTWRDMKSWEDHIYVTADNAPDGVVIIDMSNAPDDITFKFWNPPVNNQDLASCHNLYIDENGFMYLAGCSIDGGNKAIIFDLKDDKWNPTLIAAHGGTGGDDEYAHDLMVQDNIMYSSQIYKGALVLYDVTDKENIEYLGEAPTSFDFTHNAWVSEDGNYVYTTDERANAFVDAYDISDYNNIKRLDMFQPLETTNTGTIPHNTHFMNEYLITSWYSDGVVITDAARPDNLIKVGSFDSWPGDETGFTGCWGAFPYLPSGLILANDRATGLYVLQPNYVRGCYLEGLVTDQETGDEINGVEVTIIADQMNARMTNAGGQYKTGLATAGTYMVRFTHPVYNEVIAEAVLDNGELTILDIQMTKPPFLISGLMVEAGTNQPIAKGAVSIITSDRSLELVSDDSGRFTINVNPESHDIIAAAWGYKHLVQTYVPVGSEDLILTMEPGYMDDFILDQGWIVTGDATAGIWERAVPERTEFLGEMSNIGADVDGDLGNLAYVTGNVGGEARVDDVDGGSTNLITPEMDLTIYENPVIEFKTYFYNGGGNDDPNDLLTILVTDENSVSEEAIIITENTGTWTDKMTIDLRDYPSLDLTTAIRVIYSAEDIPGGNLLECGLDEFRVLEAEPSSLLDLEEEALVKVYPNPAESVLNIETEISDVISVELVNELGQKLYSAKKVNAIDVSQYPEGAYLLNIVRESGDKIITKVLIK